MAAVFATVWCSLAFSVVFLVICFSAENLTTNNSLYTPPEDNETVTIVPVVSTTTLIPTEEPDVPMPLTGFLPVPQTDVSRWCPCDVDLEVCDVNCCCDRLCGDDVPLFTSCSFSSVSGSKQLCNYDVALYILRTTITGYSELISSVKKETSYDVFCIELQNRVDGLSHPAPVVPTQNNFQELFKQFSSFLWGSAVGDAELPAEDRASPGYQFGDVMLKSGDGGMFYLPAAAVTTDCMDKSPAAFLKDQRSVCVRRVVLSRDCESHPGLSMDTYSYVQLLMEKDMNAEVVPVEVDSVILQSGDGTQTKLNLSGGGDLLPNLLNPNLCNNVVLKVDYVIKYTSAGQVVNATVSLVLGLIQEASVLLQQEFQITFIQKDGENLAVRFSGRPGYVVGMPLVSGSKAPGGVSRSLDLRDTVSVLQSSPDQDCLKNPLQRSPILFGLDTVSGCTLRVEDITNCSLVFQLLLDVLRGTEYHYVASFGNSPLENLQDWVQIESIIYPAGTPGCTLPVSRHFEVKWTKYGSLLNPQAQIVSVKEVIYTNTSGLMMLPRQGILPVSSSVAFIPISGPAHPGYRAMPTIQAELPYDFFFPFV